jgi:hypothetical protein
MIIIDKYASIYKENFTLNGKPLFHSDKVDLKAILSDYYYQMNIDYLKFFKMDNMSKAGFLLAEILLKNMDMENEKIGLFYANSFSSLDTDVNYQSTIGDQYFPSPSLFVYTLPNIVLGEICIRHKIYSENVFLIGKDMISSQIIEYAQNVMREKQLNKALIGWLDVYKDFCEAHTMLITQSESGMELNKDNVKHIFN